MNVKYVGEENLKEVSGSKWRSRYGDTELTTKWAKYTKLQTGNGY